MRRLLSVFFCFVFLFPVESIASLPLNTTICVSLTPNGTTANGFSEYPSISDDGRYIVFLSLASNLLGPNGYGGQNVFLYDQKTKQKKRIVDFADGASISGDGRYIVFASESHPLVPNDTNNYRDVFVYDQMTSKTTRVSVASDGSQGNNQSGGESSTLSNPSISGDGRYIAFSSWASNLVSNDTNNTMDVFVHDQRTGKTTRVSVASDGTQTANRSYDPVISTNGRYIAFSSADVNLVNTNPNGLMQVFVHDQNTGKTTLVSVASNNASGDNASFHPSISGDGRYIAFTSYAANLVSGDTNGRLDIFVLDQTTRKITRVSVSSNGAQGSTSEDSDYSSISNDGRYVTFRSAISTLVKNDTNGKIDVFVSDRKTGKITRVSVANDGSQGDDDSGYSYSPFLALHHEAISGNGRYIVFSSLASNLVKNDKNKLIDVFVYDQGVNVAP